MELTLTPRVKEILSQVESVIIRRKFGKDPKWEVVTTTEAYTDITICDILGDDGYYSEDEALSEFLSKAGRPYSWRKSDRYSYRFINITKADAISECLEQHLPIDTTGVPAGYSQSDYSED